MSLSRGIEYDQDAMAVALFLMLTTYEKKGLEILEFLKVQDAKKIYDDLLEVKRIISAYIDEKFYTIEVVRHWIESVDGGRPQDGLLTPIGRVFVRENLQRSGGPFYKILIHFNDELLVN